MVVSLPLVALALVLLRQAAVDAHIQAVSIEQILAGRKEGHGLRWACDFTDNHKHTTNSAILVLRDHCDDAKAAKKPITTRIQDASEPIDSFVGALERPWRGHADRREVADHRPHVQRVHRTKPYRCLIAS